MKIRALIVSILGILVVSSVSPAQVAGVPEQEPQEPAFQQSDSPTPAQPKPSFVSQTAPKPTPQPRRTPRLSAKPTVLPTHADAKSPTEVKLFRLRHADAVELANMIKNVFRIQVHADERLNNIVINARPEQMESIKSLIEATDVEASEASTSRDVQNLVYRIYMFEIASGDEGMKPFSMILQVPPEVSTTQIFDSTVRSDLQISGFCLSDELDRDGKAEILIQGRAASPMALKRMVIDEITESRIKELKWDDAETFTGKIAAAQYTQLPEQMQKHIGTFLGDDIRTVGYWFGNLSVPGEVQAPIGPWTLTLTLDTKSDHMLELSVEVEMPGDTHNFDRRIGRERNNEILSNTIRAKIGKPVIIGYNRESYGTRKMGAMVIVPEVDMIQ